MNANQEIIAELRRVLNERDQEREACAMYAERSGRFAEQADRLQADLDDCRARNADMRTMLERVTQERDQRIRERDQARAAEERARESLDELDAAIYECLPSKYDDDSPLDCVEHAADRLRELAEERDEARAEATRRLDELNMVQSQLTLALNKRDEARAELAKLREDYDSVLEANVSLLDGAPYVDARNAYRRGAEAMREACVGSACAQDLDLDAQDRMEEQLRALPIPEEP